MVSSKITQHPAVRECAYQGMVVLIATYFVLIYHNGAQSFLDLDNYLTAHDYLPYQYRILTAWLGAPLVSLFSLVPGLAEAISQRAAPFNSLSRLSFMVINCISLVVLTNLVRFHLVQLTKDKAFALGSSLFISAVLLFNLVNYLQSNYYLPYDLTSVAFFYGLFLLGVYGRLGLYLAVFAVSVFNRETVIFISGILFLIQLSKGQYKTAVVLLLVQIVVWVAIKYYLYHLLIHNIPEREGSSVFMLNLGLNWSYLKSPIWWPMLLSCFGFLWVPVLLWFKQIQDTALKIAIATFPLYVGIMIFVGQIIEMRIYTEFAPLFFVAFATLLYQRCFYKK